MKKIVFTAFIMVLCSLSGYSQSWSDALIRADGKKNLDGVEALYSKTTCNGEDVLLIKFINHNNYDVKLMWINAAYSKGEWIYAIEQSKFEITSDTEISGSCDSNNMLFVKIKSILSNPQDFEHFSVSGLSVTKN
jgi:hypothetical protein